MNAEEVVAKTIHLNCFPRDDEEDPFIADVALTIVNALKAEGYAVVELPEPNCATDELESHESAAWIDLTLGAESVSVVDDEVAMTADAGFYAPAEARKIAAALLAAADAAESADA